MPNVEFEMDHSTYTIYYKTARAIEEGEELSISKGVRKAESEATTAVAEVEDAGPGIDKVKERLRIEWYNEIVPFEELSWTQVTTKVALEDQVLTTCECVPFRPPARC